MLTGDCLAARAPTGIEVAVELCLAGRPPSETKLCYNFNSGCGSNCKPPSDDMWQQLSLRQLDHMGRFRLGPSD